MSGPKTITDPNLGGGTDNAYSREETVLALEALVIGEPVKFADATEIAASSYTTAEYGTCVVDCEIAGYVCGVAKHAAAAGESVQIYVSGYCPHVLTDGTVAEGQALIPAAGAADGNAIGTTPAFEFGVALEADVSTVLSGAILNCHGW